MREEFAGAMFRFARAFFLLAPKSCRARVCVFFSLLCEFRRRKAVFLREHTSFFSIRRSPYFASFRFFTSFHSLSRERARRSHTHSKISRWAKRENNKYFPRHTHTHTHVRAHEHFILRL